MACIFPLIVLAIYAYFGFALMTIANKKGVENSWLAFIPIANIWLMLQIIKKPTWWIILFFIPIANIVVTIIVWMAIAEAMGFPNWWGILMIVPFVNFVVPGYLAWGRPTGPAAGAPPTPPAPPPAR